MSCFYYLCRQCVRLFKSLTVTLCKHFEWNLNYEVRLRLPEHSGLLLYKRSYLPHVFIHTGTSLLKGKVWELYL